MTDKKKLLKLNNKGSAIVTVLIVIIFVSILATTILYLAGRNARMKATDRQTKESFYETERTMEEIKAGLVRISSLAYEDAYRRVISEYASYNESGRSAIFCEAYTESFVNRWRMLTNGCRDLASDPTVTISSPVPDPAPGGSSGLDEGERTSGILYVRGVEVKDRLNDYTTIIRTDFAIVCPEVSFNINYDTSVPDTYSAGEPVNINDSVRYINWEKR